MGTRSILAALCYVAIFCGVPVPASAQWLKVPSPGLPRTPDGKPDLSAPTPRTANGRPDLSGIWEPTGFKFLTSLDSDGAMMSPQPWALKKFLHNQATASKDDPDAHCTPPGVPRIDAVPNPFKIIEYPKEVVILYEAFTIFRQIFTDGRGLPEDPNPAWLGYSIGRWDGDTFVVESSGFNDTTWLDNAGHPHSEALHVTERFRRPNTGRLTIEVTIDDPKAYMRPFTLTEDLHLLPDTDVLEFVCNENNKDLQHLVGK